MYLKITNPGICYPEAFTVLGVSTARDEASKIGQFGSGAKMGINTCLRHGINPVIVSGNMSVTFDCIEKSMGTKKFNQVIAIIDGEKKELGFATDFGAIDWTKIDYALREFVSNAYDQGACHLSVVGDIAKESVGSTSVYVEYTPQVAAYHLNIDKYFLPRDELRTIIDNNSEEFRVYRKGVLVRCDEDMRALFAYNINTLKVDESRNADTYVVRYYVATALRCMGLDQAKKLVLAFVNDDNVAEVKSIDPDYIEAPIILEAFKSLYGARKIVSLGMYEFCSNKSETLPVNDVAFKMLARHNVPIAEVRGGEKGAKNGYIPIDVTTDCKRIFNRIWKKLEKSGYTNGKQIPALEMYSKPMHCGVITGGYYDNNVVYIERNHANAKVIPEEIGHHVTGADDCTRDFQDWAFSVAGSLL
jgi:hypothetical protein